MDLPAAGQPVDIVKMTQNPGDVDDSLDCTHRVVQQDSDKDTKAVQHKGVVDCKELGLAVRCRHSDSDNQPDFVQHRNLAVAQDTADAEDLQNTLDVFQNIHPERIRSLGGLAPVHSSIDNRIQDLNKKWVVRSELELGAAGIEVVWHDKGTSENSLGMVRKK